VPIITSNISGYGSDSIIGISGSIVFTNPQLSGSDTTFFVSGSSSARAVFAGTMIVSGSLVTSGSTFLGDNSDEDLFRVKATSSLQGRTSIGTTSTTSLLTVSGSSIPSMPTMTVSGGVSSPTDGAGLFDVQNSGGTSILFVTGTLGTIGGRVGIGTNSPAARFHVVGSYGGSSHGIQIGAPNLLGVASNTYTSLQHTFYGGDGTTHRLIIGTNGNLLAGGNLGLVTNTARLLVTGSSTASDQGIVYKSGVTSPIGALLDIQNSSGRSLLSVSGSGAVLDISSGDYNVNGGLRIGGDVGATSRTNSTSKIGVITVPHYTTSATNVSVIGTNSASGFTYTYIGGGWGSLNASTKTAIYAGSTTTTAGGTEILSITTSGVTLQSTNTSFISSLSGQGIKLPSSPGNGDANTLDCYTEGTWTPADGSGAGNTITQTGGVTARYTQQGRQVTCFCDITYPATILGGASAASITLPVAAGSNQGGHFIGGGSTALWGIITNTTVSFYNFNTLTPTTNTTLGPSRRLIFTLSYFVS
jgi:hypothetical protein